MPTIPSPQLPPPFENRRRPSALPVVVIPVYNAPTETIQCIQSLIANTHENVELLVMDDCGQDRRAFDFLENLSLPSNLNLKVHRMSVNQGFVICCNTAFDLAGERDVILLNSDVMVGPEWLTRLVDAAYSSADVATVTAMTNYGTIASVPYKNSPTRFLPPGISIDEAAIKIARRSLRLYPVLPTAVGHCMYIKRAAINLIGKFDLTFDRGYGEEVDFSQRLIRIGLKNILADDVFVFHKGESSFGEAAQKIKDRHQAIIESRYPWYPEMNHVYSTDRCSTLALSLEVARFALIGSVIAIDATYLSKYWDRLQFLSAQMIFALADHDPQQNFTVMISTDFIPEVRRLLKSRPNITLQFVPDINEDSHQRFDVVFRFSRICSREELFWLNRISDRVVIGQTNLSSLYNPAEFVSTDDWLQFRQFAEVVMNGVDGILFPDKRIKTGVIRGGLMPLSVASSIAPYGVDHQAIETAVHHQIPSQLTTNSDPLIVVFGSTNFHKARVFALQVLESLLKQGWRGKLALIGGLPENEDFYVGEIQDLVNDDQVWQQLVHISQVSEAERSWLLSESSLVIVPTMDEEFGLLPFEAAAHGTPSISFEVTGEEFGSSAEIRDLGTFDPALVASQCLKITSDPSLADSILFSIQNRASENLWATWAGSLRLLFEQVLIRPKNAVLSYESSTSQPTAT